MSPAKRTPPPADCAQCGDPIPPQARACPGCGADERTGWRETSLYDGLDLPDDPDNAPPEQSASRRDGVTGLRWYWGVTLIAVLIVLALGALGLTP